MVFMPYVSEDANELTQQIHHQDSPTCHSHYQDDGDISPQAVHSQNQCISSVSDESYKLEKAQTKKPLLFMGNPTFGFANHQVTPMVQHAYADHYLNGLYAAYGSHPMIPPQIAPARVPLPLDLSEDGPIYVNAKQYHGILRRRQIRAKLEAQNKLVKNRKPYLHESRHKHALNRVRGSGGRFLPTKKTQQSKANHHRFLNCSDSHSSGSEHMMMNHGFSWGIRGNEGFGDPNRGR
ncbi:putative transcription factor Hap2/NF-YA family [Helianthus annuus]|nr:putative transcription factor Hap2/NF-YA family [Helianthus annuus]